MGQPVQMSQWIFDVGTESLTANDEAATRIAKTSKTLQVG
jgi:hypothetical protein